MAYYGNQYPQGPPPPQPGPGLGLQGCCGGGTGTCCLLINGVTQILLGLICIALGAAILESGPLGELVEQIYIPIWAGCVFFMAGLLGVAILCCNGVNGDDNFWNNCMTIIFAIACAIAALCALGLLGWEDWVASEFGRYNDFYCDLFSTIAGGFADALDVGCSDYERVYYMRLSVAVFGGIEFLAAIIGAVLACCRCCGGQDAKPEPFVVQQQYAGNPYAQNPPPYAQTPSPYAGYGQPQSVYYNGQSASYQPGGYMYR